LTCLTKARETDWALDKQLSLSLFIPVVFLALAGGIKSIVKHELFWSNFYIGIDAALAALANGVINVVDLSRGLTLPKVAADMNIATKMCNNAIVLVVSFSVLVFVMIVHQRFDSLVPIGPPQSWQLRRGIWLGIVANLFGAVSLGIFIFYRLQGKL
jgi:hypothetical protein